MPLITVRLIEGVLSPAQKSRMIEELTDAMVEIEGESTREVTSIIVDETKSGEWSIAGQPLTTADVKNLQAAQSPTIGGPSVPPAEDTQRPARVPRSGPDQTRAAGA